ncbi:MAG: hypothetical protein KBG15_12920 [Kofleriaceae bacterium]|nr:hypothetical protein [Kofleriaceae bacterium]
MWKILTYAGLLGALAAACAGARPGRPAPAPVPAARPVPPTSADASTAADGSSTSALNAAAIIAMLTAPQPAAPMTVVRIGAAELDAATPINSPENESPTYIDASAISVQGPRTRIAFDTPDLRMMLWVPSRAMAQYVAADLVLPQLPGVGREPRGFAKLRAGALVEVLSQHADQIEIRHLGALQVTGTVPRSALTSSVSERRIGAPVVGNNLLLFPGALIRQQPTITAPVVATVNTVYPLIRLRSVDAIWDEVAYSDFSVDVRGYYAETMPPGSRIQRQQRSQLSLENLGDTPLPAGTCLYTSVGGAITGIIKNDCKATVTASARNGWSTAELATPWGPLTVALRTTAPATGHPFATCTDP